MRYTPSRVGECDRLHVVPRGLPSPYPLIYGYVHMYVCRRSIEYLGRSARDFPMIRLSIQVPCLDASLLIRAHSLSLMIMLI